MTKHKYISIGSIYKVFFSILVITLMMSCNRFNDSSSHSNQRVSEHNSTNIIDKEALNNLKPNNVEEAICMLDYMFDNDQKKEIINSENGETYFTIELYIRNEWIRSGSLELNQQLFGKLKLGHIDYSSGLIMQLYKYFLNRDTTQISNLLNFETKADSLKEVKNEIEMIIKKIEKCDCESIIRQKLAEAPSG